MAHPSLERLPCHDAVLKSEDRQQRNVDCGRDLDVPDGAAVDGLRDRKVGAKRDSIENCKQEYGVAEDAIGEASDVDHQITPSRGNEG